MGVFDELRATTAALKAARAELDAHRRLLIGARFEWRPDEERAAVRLRELELRVKQLTAHAKLLGRQLTVVTSR